MDENQRGLALVEEIRNSFPDVSTLMDTWLRNMWDDDKSPLPWALLIEQFSQATTNAISQGNETTANEHLQFVKEKLTSGNSETVRFLDTYYVESLLWGIKDLKQKKWGWSLLPEEIKSLYVAMWGEPKFK